MSDTFTASNEVQLRVNEGGWIERRNGGELGTGIWSEIGGINTTGPSLVWDALSEFLEHQRDEELGRWRWPEKPNYVVYPKKPSAVEPVPGVRVVHEKTGRSRDVGRESMGTCDGTASQFWHAAAAYFAAHPEPKPWHDAKPGEVWAIEHAAGGETVWSVSSDFTSRERTFRPVVVTDPNIVGMRVTAAIISSARRIWPEVTP